MGTASGHGLSHHHRHHYRQVCSFLLFALSLVTTYLCDPFILVHNSLSALCCAGVSFYGDYW